MVQGSSLENKSIRNKISKHQEAKQIDLQDIMQDLSQGTKRNIEMLHDTVVSNWLTFLPIGAKDFSLNEK